jgi:hypothetical protein
LIIPQFRQHNATPRGFPTMDVLVSFKGLGYLECGRFKQPDRGRDPAWTHPVIANGKHYVRDQDLLFCYDITATTSRQVDMRRHRVIG